MALIRYNAGPDGYIANYVELPDVGDAQLYEGNLPDNFQEVCRFCRVVDGIMVLDEALMQATREQEAQEQARLDEIMELEAWLAGFDIQNAEYKRCVELGVPWDGNIEALKAEAKTKQLRLIELQAQGG